ncbi:MAG: hypothetical protein IJ997_01475, partial [Mycoplasmataceae bacterium]|nr:hypothetical protein [Mycoplasmataceae bacterium]
MPTYYPTIYNNTHIYSKLQANSIVLTTEKGFSEVVAVNNTILICDETGNWKTDSLDNYATSKEIEDLQNYDNALQQSITNNITAIANLQKNLDDNYYNNEEANEIFIDNTELSNSLSNYVLTTTYNSKITELTSSITKNIQDISSLQSDVDNLSDSLSDYVLITTYNGKVTELTSSITKNIQDIGNLSDSLSDYVLTTTYNGKITELTNSIT